MDFEPERNVGAAISGIGPDLKPRFPAHFKTRAGVARLTGFDEAPSGLSVKPVWLSDAGLAAVWQQDCHSYPGSRIAKYLIAAADVRLAQTAHHISQELDYAIAREPRDPGIARYQDVGSPVGRRRSVVLVFVQSLYSRRQQGGQPCRSPH